jgi:hypothetical protein
MEAACNILKVGLFQNQTFVHTAKVWAPTTLSRILYQLTVAMPVGWCVCNQIGDGVATHTRCKLRRG